MLKTSYCPTETVSLTWSGLEENRRGAHFPHSVTEWYPKLHTRLRKGLEKWGSPTTRSFAAPPKWHSLMVGIPTPALGIIPHPQCSELSRKNAIGVLQGQGQSTAWPLLGCRAGLLCSQGLPLLCDAARRGWGTKHAVFRRQGAGRGGWCWCHLPRRRAFPREGTLALAVTCLLPLHKGGHPEHRQIKPEPTENLCNYSCPNTPPTPALWRLTPLEKNPLAHFTAHSFVITLSNLWLEREEITIQTNN